MFVLGSSRAASMPFQADALNDLSSRPPWSVTIQATYFCAVVPPGVGVLGALPQDAAARLRPPAATTATTLIPRAGRKTFSFRINRRNTCDETTSGAYAGR